MIRLKKRLCFVLVFVFIISILSSCSSSGNDSDGNTNNEDYPYISKETIETLKYGQIKESALRDFEKDGTDYKTIIDSDHL